MNGLIDAHHHLWDPARRTYPWMTGEAASLRRPFRRVDYAALATAYDVAAGIVVQAAADEGETRELLAEAGSDGPVQAVIGWVDLTAPDVGERIDRLRGGPVGQRLVGLRHLVHDEPDPEWLRRPDVHRGLRAVADAGLVYDLLVRPRELPAALAAVRAVPELAFVLDHAGKPPIATGQWEPWRTGVTALAAEPQVSCKLSGLVTEAGPAWTVDAIVPYARMVLDLFGPQRVMFGSDWPVCTLVASYADVLGLARAALDDTDETGRTAVFGGTAARVYRLALRAP